MDEKERKQIEKRADFYAETKWGHKEFSSERSKRATMFECSFDHLQGALDQDPISRKKRTEEIKDAIFKDPQLQKSLRYADYDRILTLIETFP